MADMLRDVRENATTGSIVNVDALKSDIRAAIINKKANACPIAVRYAWHSSGTYDKNDNTGGSNGATIRHEPEISDPANAGLSIIDDLLLSVKDKHPEISYADLITACGAVCVEFIGGPKIPFKFGRSDDSDNKNSVAHGRLPDAAQGADHLRQVFGRMGFNDQEIVALSGAHTLGRCHAVRSGFDGPWTSQPLRFDNEYFRNLINLEWQERKWDGPVQYEDVKTQSLMMLPTDISLVRDPSFRKYVEIYAVDEQRFFNDFAKAFSKLLALGCPAHTNPSTGDVSQKESEADKESAKFRELAMHGSVHLAKQIVDKVDVNQLEASSGRSALHKAAFWGHIDMVNFLLKDCKLDANVQDHYGDTALHDAARFGHSHVCQALLDSGANQALKNQSGATPLDIARKHQKQHVIEVLTASAKL